MSAALLVVCCALATAVLTGCESGTLSFRYRPFTDEIDQEMVEALEHENEECERVVELLIEEEHGAPCPPHHLHK